MGYKNSAAFVQGNMDWILNPYIDDDAIYSKNFEGRKGLMNRRRE